jgi:NADH dehydrogenase FAD-containing subunit
MRKQLIIIGGGHTGCAILNMLAFQATDEMITDINIKVVKDASEIKPEVVIPFVSRPHLPDIELASYAHIGRDFKGERNRKQQNNYRARQYR